MTIDAHLAISRQGVADWNEWRENNSDIVPDLSKAEHLRKRDTALARKRAREQGEKGEQAQSPPHPLVESKTRLTN